MSGYARIRPLLFALAPERAHRLALRAIAAGLVPHARLSPDPRLRRHLLGLDFQNPLGLAAGFDKNAEAPNALLELGFGFVEAGTVTPRPQQGNPRPRLFRLERDEAIVNRLGFNNDGADLVHRRLAARRRHGIVGVNIGANRDSGDRITDYAAGVARFADVADYLVINVSSPNTPGLRALQARAQIEELISRVNEARRASPVPKQPPLLVKVGPDLDESEIRGIAEVALATGVDGLIVGNTTVARPSSLKSRHASAPGGLSGKPLLALSTSCLATMYRLTHGRIPVIGCGGIANGADAYTKIRAGASLVQLYSALAFRGPGLVARIKRELAAKLRADGFASVREAVGADVR
jgi:dihydroorotate dehydrogenase